MEILSIIFLLVSLIQENSSLKNFVQSYLHYNLYNVEFLKSNNYVYQDLDFVRRLPKNNLTEDITILKYCRYH